MIDLTEGCSYEKSDIISVYGGSVVGAPLVVALGAGPAQGLSLQPDAGPTECGAPHRTQPIFFRST